MATSDEIGARGEAIFVVLITDLCGRSYPYFRPHFLGEKFAALDYLVELTGVRGGTLSFFVQVRTTRLGYTKKSRRRRVGVSEAEMRGMARDPAPTYLVGTDEPEACGYIVSVNDPRKAAGLSSFPTEHPLDCRNLGRLW